MQAASTSHEMTPPRAEEDRLVLSERSCRPDADDPRSDATHENDAQPLEEAGYGYGV